MSPLKRVDIANRKAGLQALREGQLWEDVDPKRSEKAYRRAAKHLVEAFLEDRQANADLFVVAHRVGVTIEERFGCIYESQPNTQMFRLNCPLDKIHSRMGVSIAAITESECSICGAGDLDCDHIPGKDYNGQACFRRVSNFIAIDHVAFTSNPDFAYSFIGQPDMSQQEAEEILGRRLLPDEVLKSWHCRDCYGRYYPKADDLDPSLWPELDPHEPGQEQ